MRSHRPFLTILGDVTTILDRLCGIGRFVLSLIDHFEP